MGFAFKVAFSQNFIYYELNILLIKPSKFDKMILGGSQY